MELVPFFDVGDLEDTQNFNEGALPDFPPLDADESYPGDEVNEYAAEGGKKRITNDPLQCMLKFQNIKSK